MNREASEAIKVRLDTYVDKDVKDALERISEEKNLTLGSTLRLLLEKYYECKTRVPSKVLKAIEALAEEWNLPADVVMFAIVLKGLEHKEDVKNLASLLQLARETIE